MKPIRLPVYRVDHKSRTVWVQSKKGNIFPCHIEPKYTCGDMRIGDDAVVVKSAVSGEWLCIDYCIDTPVNHAIQESMEGC